jgi:hypothetical protein
MGGASGKSLAFESSERRLFVLYNVVRFLKKKGEIRIETDKQIIIDMEAFGLRRPPAGFTEDDALKIAVGFKKSR